MGLYKQCRLSREGRNQVSFIPAEIAVEGQTVSVKENGVWDRGWLVEKAYDPAISWEAIQVAAKQARDTRDASDV